MTDRVYNARTDRGVPDAAKEGKYLTFKQAAEEYGIGILNVKEIIGLMPIRPVPKSPECVKGVINLRGKVIPVIDLRRRFDMAEVDRTEQSCIIVIEPEQTSGRDLTGIMVDSVTEVVNINDREIEEPPSLGEGRQNDWILGMTKKENAVNVLLDIQRVFDGL